MRTGTRTAAVLGCLLLAAGCASTKVANTWKNPEYQGPPPKRVLVVASAPGESLRLRLEQELAAKLSAEHVEAVPMSKFISSEADLTRDAVKQVAQENGFDGVVVARFKGTKEQVSYAPGAYGFDQYWGVYGPGAYAPVQVTEEQVMETNLFDARDGKLLWTATTETFSSGSAKKDVGKYVNAIVKRMDKDVLS